LNRIFSNTKGEIWVASDWVENLFSIPNQNKPYKGHEMDFALIGSPFVLPRLNLIIRVIGVISGYKCRML